LIKKRRLSSLPFPVIVFGPSLIFLIHVLWFVWCWDAGVLFSTGIVARETVVPWSIGIGQVAFALLAGVLALSVPHYSNGVRFLRQWERRGDRNASEKLRQNLDRLQKYSASLLILNFFVGTSAIGLDPFWWVTIQNHVLHQRYPLPEDYRYPEVPMWLLGSLYLYILCMLLFATLRAGSTMEAYDPKHSSK
jgi:hypothetical protein